MSAHIVKEPNDKKVKTASDFLKLASDPTRFKILWALLHAKHSVTQLAGHVKAQPPAVSQHLAKLRAANIVTVTRKGNKIYYEISNKHMRKAIEYALLYAIDIS